MGNIKYYRELSQRLASYEQCILYVRMIYQQTLSPQTLKALEASQSPRGLETVWDFRHVWRTFNWRTANTEEVVTFEGDENILNNFSNSNVQ